MGFRAKKVDIEIEKQLLIGLIVSDTFLKRIIKVVDMNLLELDTSRILVKWVVSYFKKYNKAPGNMIQRIFEEQNVLLDDAECDWIENFLINLNNEYEKKGFNEAYLFDRCVEYFKKQHLKKSSKKIMSLLEQGKIKDAEDIWLKKMKSQWHNQALRWRNHPR